ncbi:PAS domain-containing protein [Methylobacterium sp. Leaf89]|uniref:helix-turn-helix domain-containing protein n=1 Tax=Methylobacterium sp. Leaf89 TaxID=1736245 RepID=UPI0006F37E54|nr:PAS domain-containing protein [Methylobacterium sp. Leaf89]KQO68623.1 hypothetical protein ASF18_03345 [Methylobacterium sp. Leaf89]
MDVDSLPFSSKQFLRLLDSQGISGTWEWHFASDQHVWSSGLFRILGLDPQTTRPSYELLIGLVHPEDRGRMASGSGLIGAMSQEKQTIRVIRPGGSNHVLSLRSEIHLAPDGRPQGIAGSVLDVTERENLRRALAAERRRRRALFDRTRTLTFSNDPDYAYTFTEEAYELTGLSPEETADDAFLAIVTEEREHWRAVSLAAHQAGQVYTMKPVLYIAGGKRERFEIFTVPIVDGRGQVVDWSNLARPLGTRGSPPVGMQLKGLEQAIAGRHLRAARALLDWSMSDFARAAGLSLSTVKRMEEHPDGTAQQSRHKAVETLRRFGIRFSVMDDGLIAVGHR